MQNLIMLLLKYGSVILFVLLEIFCFYLIVRFNPAQESIFINSSNIFVGSISKEFSEAKDYLSLKKLNDSLSTENARLYENFLNLAPNYKSKLDSILQDSLTPFDLIPAAVINNSVNKLNNSITLNRGEKHGIRKGMGIIDHKGLVGIVKNTSASYSQVNSVLNRETRISVKLKKGGYLGNLEWKKRDPRTMMMSAVPKHAVITPGDTVLTSGYSTIFPADMFVGIVESHTIDNTSGFLKVVVALANDLHVLKNVYAVKIEGLDEINSLKEPINE